MIEVLQAALLNLINDRNRIALQLADLIDENIRITRKVTEEGISPETERQLKVVEERFTMARGELVSILARFDYLEDRIDAIRNGVSSTVRFGEVV